MWEGHGMEGKGSSISHAKQINNIALMGHYLQSSHIKYNVL